MQEPQGINSQSSVNTRWQNTTQRYHTQDSTTLALYALIYVKCYFTLLKCSTPQVSCKLLLTNTQHIACDSLNCGTFHWQRMRTPSYRSAWLQAHTSSFSTCFLSARQIEHLANRSFFAQRYFSSVCGRPELCSILVMIIN